MNRRLQLLKYLASDVVTALIGWCLFYFYWKHLLVASTVDPVYIAGFDSKFTTGLFIVPFFWILLYYLAGYYNDVIRKSRLLELWQTAGNVFTGVLIIYVTFSIHNSYLTQIRGSFSPFFDFVCFSFYSHLHSEADYYNNHIA